MRGFNNKPSIDPLVCDGWVLEKYDPCKPQSCPNPVILWARHREGTGIGYFVCAHHREYVSRFGYDFESLDAYFIYEVEKKLLKRRS